MPSGVHFRAAGGSWSHPFAPVPSDAVRVFPPADVRPLGHLGLRVHRDLQRPAVAPRLLADGRHVGEDGVGGGRLLERPALPHPDQPVAHAVEDVPHGPLARQVGRRVPLGGTEAVEHLPGGQVGVPPVGLQLRVGVGPGLDHVPDVGRQSGVGVLRPGSPAGREVLHAPDAGGQLVQAGVHGVPAPAEPALGLAGTPTTQGNGHLGLEQALLVTGQAIGGPLQESVGRLDGVVHDSGLGW